jgi:hypothetical protein
MLCLEQRIHLIQCWIGFCHIITKFNETVMHHAWVFRSLKFDTGLNYVQKAAHT